MVQVAVYPTGLQFTVVEFPLCSLYFCSLLARLNAREYAKGSTSLSSHDTPLQFTNPKRGTNDNVLYLGDMRGSKNSEGSGGVTVVPFTSWLARYPDWPVATDYNEGIWYTWSWRRVAQGDGNRCVIMESDGSFGYAVGLVVSLGKTFHCVRCWCFNFCNSSFSQSSCLCHPAFWLVTASYLCVGFSPPKPIVFLFHNWQNIPTFVLLWEVWFTHYTTPLSIKHKLINPLNTWSSFHQHSQQDPK